MILTTPHKKVFFLLAYFRGRGGRCPSVGALPQSPALVERRELDWAPRPPTENNVLQAAEEGVAEVT